MKHTNQAVLSMHCIIIAVGYLQFNPYPADVENMVSSQ